MKYGTVPVVRATGGLDDTITQFDPSTGEGNGFKFGPYEPSAFLEVIRNAVALASFADRAKWPQLMKNGMARDFSWQRSARSYLALYESLVRR